MASYDTTRPMVDGRTFGVRPHGIFARLFGAVAAWNDARITRNALAKLSDHELEDLGLNRGDIDTIAASWRR